jgi:hypothetical protein
MVCLDEDADAARVDEVEMAQIDDYELRGRELLELLVEHGAGRKIKLSVEREDSRADFLVDIYPKMAQQAGARVPLRVGESGLAASISDT